MLAAITSEVADIVRPRAWTASRWQSRKPFSSYGDQEFESIPLQRRVVQTIGADRRAIPLASRYP